MKKRILAAICLSVILAALPSFADDNDIYDSQPSISPYYAGSVKREVLEKALSELNYVRRLIKRRRTLVTLVMS